MRWLIYFLLAIPFASQAAESFTLGAGTHFAQNRTDSKAFFDWLAKSHLKGLRDEIYWHDIEKTPNHFVLEGKAKGSADAIRKAANQGLKPIVVLGYGNRLYDDGGQPFSSEGRAAFAKYAAFVATQMGPSVTQYEVWNEWNLGGGAKPKQRAGSASDYALLVKETQKAIKSVNPKAMIIAGALGDDLGGWPWMKSAIAADLLQYSDAVSVHLYNFSMPVHKGGDAEFIERLEGLNKILTSARAGKTTPVYITEMGWSDFQGKWSTDPGDAAAVALRFLLEVRSLSYVKGVWLYEFMDGGTDPGNKEHHFGLVKRDGSEKPVACAIRLASTLLENATLLKTEQQDGIKSQLYKLADGKYVTALWRSPWVRERDSLWISVKPAQSVEVTSPTCDENGVDVKTGSYMVSNLPVFFKTPSNTFKFSIAKMGDLIGK